MSRATFHKWVIKLGFVCKKTNMKLKVYQRMDVVVQRQIYLRKLRDLKDLLDIKFSIRMKLGAMPITPDSMFGKPVETTISLVILFGKS